MPAVLPAEEVLSSSCTILQTTPAVTAPSSGAAQKAAAWVNKLEDEERESDRQDQAPATAGLNAGACAASSDPTTVRATVVSKGTPTAILLPLVEPPPTEAQMTTKARIAPRIASAAKAAFREEEAETAGAGRESLSLLGNAAAAATAAASAPATWAAERTAAAWRGEVLVLAAATAVPAEATATASACAGLKQGAPPPTPGLTILPTSLATGSNSASPAARTANPARKGERPDEADRRAAASPQAEEKRTKRAVVTASAAAREATEAGRRKGEPRVIAILFWVWVWVWAGLGERVF